MQLVRDFFCWIVVQHLTDKSDHIPSSQLWGSALNVSWKLHLKASEQCVFLLTLNNIYSFSQSSRCVFVPMDCHNLAEKHLKQCSYQFDLDNDFLKNFSVLFVFISNGGAPTGFWDRPQTIALQSNFLVHAPHQTACRQRWKLRGSCFERKSTLQRWLTSYHSAQWKWN